MEEKSQLYDANDLLSTLLYMKKEFGVDVFHNAKKMNSILGDLSPILKRDGKILQRLLIAGLFQELEETDFTNEIEKLHARGRVKNWLIDEEFIQEEKAVYYSQVVCAVYGGESECKVFAEENKENCGETFERSVSTYVEETKENNVVINNSSDFIIEDGVLKKYVGKDEVVTILEGVREIGKYAFYECKNLKSIKCLKEIETIGEWAFGCCEKLEYIKLPQNLQVIKLKAFADCKNLHEITFPEDIKIIGYGAFWGCGLKDVKLPENLEIIEAEAFSHCEELSHVVFPKGIKEIGKWAFFGCENLDYVTVPKSMERVSKDDTFHWSTIVSCE